MSMLHRPATFVRNPRTGVMIKVRATRAWFDTSTPARIKNGAIPRR